MSIVSPEEWEMMNEAEREEWMPEHKWAWESIATETSTLVQIGTGSFGTYVAR